MSEKGVDYARTTKTTILFSAVQVARILVALVRNKFVAVLLGPEGMGIIGVFNTTLGFIKTGAGLGIDQSAVRDVSEANGHEDKHSISRIISLTKRIVWMTALIGLVITISLSPLLSKWGFGNYKYTIPFVFLGLAVAFEIYTDNQLAILKGMRQLRSLAKASLIGTVVSLITGVPLFYIWGNDGIVPSIIISSLSALLVSYYYVRRVSYDRIKITIKETIKEGTPMIKMGCALMLVNFLSLLFDLIIIAFLRREGGLATVGLFQAGSNIVTVYFGIVLTAMTTDYYPRISAINSDNSLLQQEVNAQARVGTVMILPIAVMFVAFAPLFINILYSEDFYNVIQYTDIAMFGILIGNMSNCIAMVLLAKQDTKVFLSIAIAVRLINLIIYTCMYKLAGLSGLGIAFLLNNVLQTVIYTVVIKYKYNIYLTKSIMYLAASCIAIMTLSVVVKLFTSSVLLYVIESLIILAAVSFSLYQMKKMNMDIISMFRMKILKKN